MILPFGPNTVDVMQTNTVCKGGVMPKKSLKGSMQSHNLQCERPPKFSKTKKERQYACIHNALAHH